MPAGRHAFLLPVLLAALGTVVAGSGAYLFFTEGDPLPAPIASLAPAPPTSLEEKGALLAAAPSPGHPAPTEQDRLRLIPIAAAGQSARASEHGAPPDLAAPARASSAPVFDSSWPVPVNSTSVATPAPSGGQPVDAGDFVQAPTAATRPWPSLAARPLFSTTASARTASASPAAAASADLPAQIPAVFVETDATSLDEVQTAEWQQIEHDFSRDLAVPAHDPRYPARWQSAQEIADEKFRQKFGTVAFLQYQIEARRASNQP